jgi:hypothetical protein
MLTQPRNRSVCPGFRRHLLYHWRHSGENGQSLMAPQDFTETMQSSYLVMLLFSAMRSFFVLAVVLIPECESGLWSLVAIHRWLIGKPGGLREFHIRFDSD